MPGRCFWGSGCAGACPTAAACACGRAYAASASFFFGTHGTRPGSDHSRQCLAAARRLLQDNGNEVLGGFLCQGRVNPRLVALAGKPGHHPMTPARAARLAEAARHPDGADRQALVRCWDRCRQGLPLPGADAAGELDGGHFFAWSAGTGRLS